MSNNCEGNAFRPAEKVFVVIPRVATMQDLKHAAPTYLNSSEGKTAQCSGARQT